MLSSSSFFFYKCFSLYRRYCGVWDFQNLEMACLHDHSCEDHDCSTDWSLYKHIDLTKVNSLFSYIYFFSTLVNGSLHKTNQNFFFLTLWVLLVVFLKCPDWLLELTVTPLMVFLVCPDVSLVNYSVPVA